MAQIETWLKCDLTKPVKVHPLDGNVFSADSNANLIGVEIFNEGEPAAISGAVHGYAIREDGATVIIDGTLSGNKASVSLPLSCYAVIGRLSVVVKVGTLTVGAVTGNVYRTTTDTIVDPAHVIPSIDELLQKIADCEAATTAANTAAGTANTAANNANAKATLANAAADNANAKATLANTAAGTANTAAANADSKAALANTAAGTANTAANNANVKAQRADEAAGLANQKATAAQTAADNANDAAGLANQRAGEAQTATGNANAATGAANAATAEAQQAALDAANATSGANAAAAKLNGMEVEAIQGGASLQPMANISLVNGHYKITFENIKGATGEQGAQGEKGDRGDSGIIAPISGHYELVVDANGDLWAVYPDNEDPPTFEYDSATGNLYYVYNE